ncbi:hypothetical protein [Amycolatopsis sp. NPDC021455]|uniref:hypothetical protein n=1 Tax=Amycolatopsis sp. NPDC021455 TaxID=3154901 RepID=UPI0033D1AD4E
MRQVITNLVGNAVTHTSPARLAPSAWGCPPHGGNRRWPRQATSARGAASYSG